MWGAKPIRAPTTAIVEVAAQPRTPPCGPSSRRGPWRPLPAATGRPSPAANPVALAPPATRRAHSAATVAPSYRRRPGRATPGGDPFRAPAPGRDPVAPPRRLMTRWPPPAHAACPPLSTTIFVEREESRSPFVVARVSAMPRLYGPPPPRQLRRGITACVPPRRRIGLVGRARGARPPGEALHISSRPDATTRWARATVAAPDDPVVRRERHVGRCSACGALVGATQNGWRASHQEQHFRATSGSVRYDPGIIHVLHAGRRIERPRSQGGGRRGDGVEHFYPLSTPRPVLLQLYARSKAHADADARRRQVADPTQLLERQRGMFFGTAASTGPSSRCIADNSGDVQ